MDNPSDAELQAALQAYRENIDDHGRAKAMLCALIAAAQVRAKTHVSVPSEPTLDMKYEGMEAADCDIGLVAVGNVYRAMLSASGGNRD